MSEQKPENSISSQEQFRAKLLAMQTKFKQSLPARIEEINQAWQSVKIATQTATETQESLELLHRLVHTLTGSAGTFTHTQLSNDSRALEIVLKGIIETNNNHALTQEQSEQIESLLALMVSAATAPIGQTLIQETVVPVNDSTFNRKIMLIEDDEELNLFLTSQLEHFGYIVESITELKNVESAIINFKPDILVIDINFPEGKCAGIEEIKRFDFIKHFGFDVPKIFISARQDIEARLQVVRVGGSAYLSKPLNISLLLEKIRELSQTVAEDRDQILIIDDDSALVDLMTFVLEESGMDVQGVVHPKEALEAISRQKPDLILMDVHMPWCNGIELAQVIRQQISLEAIPIIFLSSETDENVQFTAVLKGGDDFLTKPIDINRLPVFIKAKAHRAKALNALMIKDGLTGLYNHTYIKELIDSEMYRCQRSNGVFSVVMLDVDHFKNVNDTYGHVVGDQVLRSLSHFLVQRLRKADKIGRYGGEEFMVLLPDTPLVAAKKLFDKILNDFAKVQHHTLDDKEFEVTFSAGLISNEITQDTAMLLEQVDQSLYKAKHAGRNQVVVTEPLNF
ncbi:diguanylate cyclase [Thiomicrorhabdus sp. Milos-T2]|uniref:diguanylate cyclase n=1 Tax=Thiomicrorhabdus sp. Milos-T2 TaxID=90814 RepID=UPI0004945FB7|nr:diguanylate cyclase [Thiomicrorhabdus sp. Milos-T2]